MKKILSMFVLLASVISSSACDICGCGTGNYYIGILPQFKKHFIGLRYQYKGLRSHISGNGGSSYLTTDETYRTMEIWGAFNLGNKFRVMGFVPYNFNERLNQGKTTGKNGIGDVVLIGYYNLFDKRKSLFTNKLLVQSLWLGGGFKLPTGKYDAADANVTQNMQNTFQLGTGSVDFSLHAMYDIRLQDIGINTNIAYKINTANSDDYRYGNKLTANMLAYYKFAFAKSGLGIAPNAGVSYERAEKDIKSGSVKVNESGGYVTVATVGIEASYKKISVGANFQSPISQHLADATVKAKNRAMIHVSFSF
jgi:hypothetical protein